MTTTALVERDAPAVIVTADQVALIKSTIAQGATDAELKLFFYDCQRRGVHPLDRLIHFTKRKGKYTPITSIDFMRGRAAETGEMAGSDDAAFAAGDKFPLSATVTVYRMTQGVRYPYTATARWEEYYPGDGDQGFMWRKMPHTMLGKCAEALALRKAFPQQLQGLYAKEEMDQAGVDVSSELPPAPPPQVVDEDTGEVIERREGLLYVDAVDDSKRGKNSRGPWTLFKITLSDGRVVNTFDQSLGENAKRATAEGFAVSVEAHGRDLDSLVLIPKDGTPF